MLDFFKIGNVESKTKSTGVLSFLQKAERQVVLVCVVVHLPQGKLTY